MRNARGIFGGLAVAAALMTAAAAWGAGDAGDAAAARPVLESQYDLGKARSAETHYYRLETRVTNYAEDGTRTLAQVYRLNIECKAGTGAEGDQCTCRKFTVQSGNGPAVRIPALDGWSYTLKMAGDEKGQVFGIEHAKFEGLKDANGTALSQDVAYAVYNSFIDFHAICNVFGQPMPGDRGVQALSRIGQKIVHAAANTEAPVSLGSNIAEGSKFKNGEVTLEFRGLSLVDGAPCALVGFDAGDSTLQMTIKPAPNMEVKTVGASHYFGEFYKDLASAWVREARLGEFVVGKATMGDQKLMNIVVERTLAIADLTKAEFEKE